MPKERIGIMGGTFNPVHQGHIAMAIAALDAASLDRVLFLPDGQPPHKTDIAPAEDRWRMVCAAVANIRHLEPSRLELDREGTTYTFDTLTHLRKEFPKADLYYIIGADTLMELHNWYRYEEVLRLCTFLVCPRETRYTLQEQSAERKRLTALGAKFLSVRMDVMNVSSSEIRQALTEEAPTPLLPQVVRAYCGLRGLYGIQPHVDRPEEWISKLFTALNLKRFAHTLGVAYSARRLAINHGIDVRKAETAALLHDCAKCMSLKDMQRICTENHLTEDEQILESTALMHSIAGAYIAKTEYGVTDPEILTAIEVHTTGKPGMSDLDMVVYLADKIEPGREGYPLLNKVRMLAPFSLKKAMLTSMEGTAAYVRSGDKALHVQSLNTIEWLRQNQ